MQLAITQLGAVGGIAITAGHVRGSNTEPIIRLSAEAETEEQVRQIAESVFGLIQERVKS